jgi:hypothetical protein
MKRIIIFLLFSSLLTGGCSNQVDKQKARESLNYEVMQVNEQVVGRNIDFMTRCTSCIFDGKNLIYSYEIDENYGSMDDLIRVQKEAMEAQAKAAWESNPQLAGTKQSLKTLGGSVIYNYVGSRSKKALTITVKP